MFELERMANYLVPLALKYVEPENLVRFLCVILQTYPLDKAWIVSNLLRMFSAFIDDFRSPAYAQGMDWLGPYRRSQDASLRDPVSNFTLDEYRFEVSTKFAHVWLEAFFIMALTWGVGTLLDRKPRKQFNLELREAIKKHTASFYSVQKARPKRIFRKEEEFLNEHLTDEFGALSSTPSEPPQFVSDFPTDYSIFECKFSIDQNKWVGYQYSSKGRTTSYLPSLQSVKYQMLLETLLMANANFALMGTTGIGKSAVLEDLIFNVFPGVKQNFAVFQTPLSHNSNHTKL